MRNRGRIIGIVIIAIVVIIGLFVFILKINDTPFVQQNIIGGDKDEGGCLVGAGYSWCESKQKCLRVWEESCAESFCLRENVANVYDCGKFVRVDSSLLGGGASYYSENMSEFSCPVVGPDYISQECKDIQGLNCKQINC